MISNAYASCLLAVIYIHSVQNFIPLEYQHIYLIFCLDFFPTLFSEELFVIFHCPTPKWDYIARRAHMRLHRLGLRISNPRIFGIFRRTTGLTGFSARVFETGKMWLGFSEKQVYPVSTRV